MEARIARTPTHTSVLVNGSLSPAAKSAPRVRIRTESMCYELLLASTQSLDLLLCQRNPPRIHIAMPLRGVKVQLIFALGVRVHAKVFINLRQGPMRVRVVRGVA